MPNGGQEQVVVRKSITKFKHKVLPKFLVPATLKQLTTY